jgi:protein subunit release factor A
MIDEFTKGETTLGMESARQLATLSATVEQAAELERLTAELHELAELGASDADAELAAMAQEEHAQLTFQRESLGLTLLSLLFKQKVSAESHVDAPGAIIEVRALTAIAARNLNAYREPPVSRLICACLLFGVTCMSQGSGRHWRR